MPVPPKSRRSGTLLTPDTGDDNKGYILGFQKTFRILEETLAIQYHNNMSFQPAFSPIAKVHSAFVYRNELQGRQHSFGDREHTKRQFYDSSL